MSETGQILSSQLAGEGGKSEIARRVPQFFEIGGQQDASFHTNCKIIRLSTFYAA